MCDVLIAMAPAALFGIWYFGFRAFLIIVLCVAASVLTEYIYEKAMKKPVTITDLSAAVTGMILALNMPVYIDLWIPVLGCVFAILIVKQLYGGLGQNFMNPALAGRCFLLISFAGQMTQFYPDGVSGATPLAALKAGEAVDLMEMFVGMIPGTIGETSVIALLIGAAYLLWMAWHMVRSAGTVAQEGDPSYPSFRRGFLIQVTNVKVMVLCLTALSGYVLPYDRSFWSLLAVGLFLPLTGPVANLVWIFAGVTLQRLFSQHRRAVDLAMAAALAVCAVTLILPH